MASYLSARQARGNWLLRMEDIDKPREQPGASEHIIRILQQLGFEWDDNILFQSQRLSAYQASLNHLSPYTYACSCSRKELQQQGIFGRYGIIYPATCRYKSLAYASNAAIRVIVKDQAIGFNDLVQGYYQQNLVKDLGDFVIKRADGIFAYQLAVVVDDEYQGVNQIIRGADLLDNTPRQLWLQHLLGIKTPEYAHIPLVLNNQGQKLSKQNLAPAISTENKLLNLTQAFAFLGQKVAKPSDFNSLQDFWDWAIKDWQLNNIPKVFSQKEDTEWH
jgi:glutamyl-Q tRNA(Asp) synthetase